MVAKPTDSESPARSKRRLSVMTPEEWSEVLSRIQQLETALAAKDHDLEQIKREASARSDSVILLGGRFDVVEAQLESVKSTVATITARVENWAGQTAVDATSMVNELRQELDLLRTRLKATECTLDGFDSGLQTWRNHDQQELNLVRTRV